MFATYEDGSGSPAAELSVNGNKQDFTPGSAFTLTSTKNIGIMNSTKTTPEYTSSRSPTGICREVLVYDTFQSANRVAIETNIQNAYSTLP